MKTLEQIKNDYIKDKYLASHDLDTWSEFQIYFANRHPEWFEVHWEEVMKIYAMECLKLAIYNSSLHGYDEEIINENNIIK